MLALSEIRVGKTGEMVNAREMSKKERKVGLHAIMSSLLNDIRFQSNAQFAMLVLDLPVISKVTCENYHVSLGPYSSKLINICALS